MSLVERSRQRERARQRRRGALVLLGVVGGWVVATILWPSVGIALLAGWLILELIGA